MGKGVSIGAVMAMLAASAALPQAGRAEQAGAGRLLEQRLAQRFDAAVPASQDIAYGADPLQHVDFWRAKAPGASAPLVIFVHGGGWKRGDKRSATGPAKVTHFLGEGYAFASIDYRLVPDVAVEQQAQDVADAVAALIVRAKTLGFDPGRVVLMGHSAGAHLAALVGTDMRYLRKAGLAPDSLAGVIPIDGAAYDVPRQITEGGKFMHATYVQTFGEDAARQRALSPTLQAARPNVPAFLILHVAREDGTAQAESLAAALTAAGTPAQVRGFAGTGLRGHMEINRRLGEPDYPATPVVDAWLRSLFAAR
ncbi:alpha/beta hydrolase [Sphingobium sp. H39-3-25]|uniref:alpha/beta fold hydrolase n=1 Tax=Sphingobium arseniciresistens TaxID=3030834 RepID=UPI0023B88B24|nr:alpha/beta hydrolase [Sphingobium arseniciresistens]